MTLRPAVAADRCLLLEVYASSRKDELDQVEWPPGQREAFLEQQFAARDLTYRGRYPAGDFLVIELDGHAISRLSVGRPAARTCPRWPGRLAVRSAAQDARNATSG